MVYMVREHLNLHPDHACIKIDVRNCHNSFGRHAALLALADASPGCRSLLQAFYAEYRHASAVHHAGRDYNGLTSQSGAQQGDPRATAIAAYVMRQDLEWLQDQLKANGGTGFVVAQSDDTYALGPPALLFDLLPQYQQRLFARTGLEVRVDKSLVHFGLTAVDPPNHPDDMPIAGEMVAGVLCPGFEVSGIPVGVPLYVRRALSKKAAGLVSENERLISTLRRRSPHALWTFLHYCCHASFGHWQQWNYHTDVKASIGPLQASMHKTFEAQLGVPGALDDLLIARRIASRISKGGCGLRDLGKLTPAAFLGALFMAAPAMIDVRAVPGGAPTPGCCPPLEALFGAGSFDDLITDGVGRWAHLLAGTSRLRDEFVAAVADAREDVDLAAYPGPLSPAIADLGYGLTKRGAQRQITAQREAAWDFDLDAALCALPRNDPRRIAYLNTRDSITAQAWCSSYPDRHDFAFLPTEWCTVVQIYLGLKLTALAPFVGNTMKPRGGTVDAYGFAIGGANLPGDHFRTRHDVVKYAIHDAAHANYYDMRCEVYGLFLPVLNQAGRIGLEGPDGVRGRSGLIPDFMDNNSGAPVLMDVKGITLTRTRYPAPANGALSSSSNYAVRKRGKLVNKEYIRKARQKDIQFSANAMGTMGPIEAKLREYGDVIPLVFGWFGEINLEFDELLEEIAETGAARHWRDMCATTPATAKGTILWQLRRKVAAAILRSNVRLLHDRLCFAVGGQTHPGDAFGRRRSARARFFNDGDPFSATWARRQMRFQRPPPPSWASFAP